MGERHGGWKDERSGRVDGTEDHGAVSGGPLGMLTERFGAAGARRIVQRKVAERRRAQKGAEAKPGAGTSLPEPVRDQMERSLGHDFSDVRVHEGPQAEAMGAVAYTEGRDLHFQPGRYQPHSASGQELLGHELTHVVQQASGRVSAPTQAKGLAVNADEGLEREADELGAKAARGEPTEQARSTSVARPSGGVRQAMHEPGADNGPTKEEPPSDEEHSSEENRSDKTQSAKENAEDSDEERVTDELDAQIDFLLTVFDLDDETRLHKALYELLKNGKETLGTLTSDCGLLEKNEPEAFATLKGTFEKAEKNPTQAKAALTSAREAVASKSKGSDQKAEEEEPEPIAKLEESEVSELYHRAADEIARAKDSAASEQKRLVVILGEQHNTDSGALASQVLLQIVSKLKGASLAMELMPDDAQQLAKNESERLDAKPENVGAKESRNELKQNLLVNEALTKKMPVVGADSKKLEGRKLQESIDKKEAEQGLVSSHGPEAVNLRNDGIVESVAQLDGPVLLVVGATHLSGLENHPGFKSHQLSIFDSSGMGQAKSQQPATIKGNTSHLSPFELRDLARKQKK